MLLFRGDRMPTRHVLLLLSLTVVVLATVSVVVAYAAAAKEITVPDATNVPTTTADAVGGGAPPRSDRRPVDAAPPPTVDAALDEHPVPDSGPNSHPHDAIQLLPEQHTLHDEKEASDGDATVSFHYWIMALGLMVVVLSQDVVHRWHLTSHLSESGAVILLGIAFGWAVMMVDRWRGDPKDSLLEAIKFDHSFFVRFALPVIIFEQGYGMHHAGVLENIHVVLLLAVPGVVASGVAIGTLLFVLSPVTYPALAEMHGGFFLCLALGALLSATDPVAVVSILRSKFNVALRPPTIYNVIFGESMLNDAVSIVLFEVALDYVHQPMTLGSLAHAAQHFLYVLLGSSLCGYAHGVVGVMLLKIVRFQEPPHFEVVLNVLIATASYYLCEFLDLSGIMALFFAARILGHYGPPHMSAEARQHAPVIFRTLASLAEAACFLLLGAAFFSYPHTWGMRFILATILACLGSRALVVYWCGRYAGRMNPGRRLTAAAQSFVWYSGMRGAVSFGLAAVLVDHCGLIGVRDDVSTMLLSSTLVVIVFTVLVLGGGATTVLEWLNLQSEEAAVCRLDDVTMSYRPEESDQGASSPKQQNYWLQRIAREVVNAHALVISPLLEK